MSPAMSPLDDGHLAANDPLDGSLVGTRAATPAGEFTRYEEAMALAAELQAEVRKTAKAGNNPAMMLRCVSVSERLELIAPRFAIDIIHIRRLASNYYGETASARKNRAQGARARLIKALDVIMREASLFNSTRR
jgi:hypothetical protein